MARLQTQLGVALLQPEGRRMVLTKAGEALLREASPLLESVITSYSIHYTKLYDAVNRQ